MAQSCDRIVQSLREAGIIIDVVHFTNRRAPFHLEQKEQGTYLACPLHEDPAHILNRLWNYLSHAPNHWTHLVAFGGFLPTLGAPVFRRWLNLPLILLLRGNDVDLSMFSPRKRPMLMDAVLAAEKVCVVTKEHQEKLDCLWPQSSIDYIPNGIDLRTWVALDSDRQRAALWKQQTVTGNRRVLGVFGQLKEKKGFIFLLESLRLSGISEQVHLLVVGEIAPEAKELLAEQASSYTVLPFMDRFELMAYYPACDAIAIPSFYDGMPNVLLEAGALGIPFIASNTAGMKDVLTSGKHGFVFETGNQHACADVLHQWIHTGTEQMLEMGTSCQHLIQENYTHVQETRRYLELFRATARLSTK